MDVRTVRKLTYMDVRRLTYMDGANIHGCKRLACMDVSNLRKLAEKQHAWM